MQQLATWSSVKCAEKKFVRYSPCRCLPQQLLRLQRLLLRRGRIVTTLPLRCQWKGLQDLISEVETQVFYAAAAAAAVAAAAALLALKFYRAFKTQWRATDVHSAMCIGDQQPRADHHVWRSSCNASRACGRKYHSGISRERSARDTGHVTADKSAQHTHVDSPSILSWCFELLSRATLSMMFHSSSILHFRTRCKKSSRDCGCECGFGKGTCNAPSSSAFTPNIFMRGSRAPARWIVSRSFRLRDNCKSVVNNSVGA
jgi:hypothetical protein